MQGRPVDRDGHTPPSTGSGMSVVECCEQLMPQCRCDSARMRRYKAKTSQNNQEIRRRGVARRLAVRVVRGWFVLNDKRRGDREEHVS